MPRFNSIGKLVDFPRLEVLSMLANFPILDFLGENKIADHNPTSEDCLTGRDPVL